MDCNVMLVDDNEYIRESVEILLQLNGIGCISAESGERCLKILDSGFRGLILMDIMMPHMDGWDTVREIVDRGLLNGNIIIMLTAINEPNIKMEGLQEYVLDYVTKPFIPDEFIEKVRCYLGFMKEAPLDEE